MPMFVAISVRTNKPLYASTARRSDGPFRCPNPECRARVGLRKGRERLPHFAHLSHQATPDCYAYSGPQIPAPGNPRRGAAVTPQLESSSNARIRVSLDGDDRTSYAIVLELPRRGESPWWPGRLFLQSKRGEFAVSCEQLQTEVRLRVGPAETYQFERRHTDVDDSYWYLVSEPIRILTKAKWTFFRDSLRAGARIPDTAPLAWGDAYWAITSSSQASSLKNLAGLTLTAIDQWEDGWWVHRFELDECGDSLDEADRLAVESALGRRIGARRTQVFLTSPSVHHITPEGVWAVAGPCDELKLRTTSRAEVEARTPDGRSLELESCNEERTFRIVHPPGGMIEFSVDGQSALQIDVGAFSPFTPPGVEVHFGGKTVDLLELSATLKKNSSPLQSAEFEFQLPCPQVLERIRVNGERILPEGPTVRAKIPANTSITIDGGPFGWAELLSDQAIGKAGALTLDLEELRSLALWLGTVTSSRGQGGGEMLAGINWARCPIWLSALRSKRWSPAYGPQLRYLRRALARKGL